MQEKEFDEQWVKQWQEGIEERFWQTCDWLWRKHCLVAINWFRQYLVDQEDLVMKLAREAFWYSMEEMDLRMTGGKFLWEKDKNDEEDKGDDSKKISKGKISGSVLKTEREMFKWQGKDKFGVLFHRILIFKCKDVLDKDDEKIRHGDFVSIEPTRDDRDNDRPRERVIFEDETPGTLPNPEEILEEREELRIRHEGVLKLIEGLGYVAEQLYKLHKKTLADTVESLLLYVKWEAINPHGSALDIEKLTDQNIANLKNEKIEDLLDSSNVQHLDFNEEESWLFVEKALSITRDDVYKRKERLFKSMRELPNVPGILKKMLGLQWLKDMQNWAEDSIKIANRLRKRDLKGAEAFDFIRDYLKMEVSRGNPCYRGLFLEQVRKVPQEKLFKANNPDRLVPIYPGGDRFRHFLSQECEWCSRCVNRMVTGTLPELRNVIANLNPRPIRLVTLLALL